MNNKEEILMNFAKHLTKMRKSKGISIRQLAAASNLEFSQIQRIEKGKVNFAFSTLCALADGLEMDLPNLFDQFQYQRE